MKQYRTIEEIIEHFNSEAHTEEQTTANKDTEVYTYMGEHYDEASSDKHWVKQFTSTELAVNITEAISYAVRDGLDNKGIAEVLSKILEEVRSR